MPKRYTIATPSVLRVTAQGTPRNAHGSVMLRVATRRGGSEVRSIDWTVAAGGWGTPHLTLALPVPGVVHPAVMVAINDAITALPAGGGVVSR